MAPHPPLYEPTFRSSEATNHWKNTVFRDFPTFSRSWIFFLLGLSLLWFSFSSLLLSSLTLPISAFHLSILSEVWFLNFLRWFSMYTKKEKHLPLHGWVDTIYRQSVPVVTLWLKVLASSQIQKMETMEATVCYLSSMSNLSTATVSTSTGEDSVGGSWGGVGAAEADWGRLLILGRVSSWMIRSFGEIWNTPYKMALSWKKVVKP